MGKMGVQIAAAYWDYLLDNLLIVDETWIYYEPLLT